MEKMRFGGRLAGIRKAVSTDRYRSVLCNVSVDKKNIVAVDGSILIYVAHGEEIKEPFLIPANFLDCPPKTGSVSVIVDDAKISATTKVPKRSYTVTKEESREVYCKYPEYEKLLEKRKEPKARIGFTVATFKKLLVTLEALGIKSFVLEATNAEDPLFLKAEEKICGNQGHDYEVNGVIMPAHMVDTFVKE